MWTIYRKELLELLRDRKTFIFTIFIPIIAMPLIFGGFAYVSSLMFRNAENATLTYAIFGKQSAPELALRLAQAKNLREVPLAAPGQIRAAIGDGRIKFALVVPDGFEASLRQQRQASIALHYNSAATVDITRKRVAALVDAHNTSLREAALAPLNMSKTQLQFTLRPIVIKEHSTADDRERIGAIVGGFLPYVLLMVCLMAAMYPAIDSGAGEKERGTLETLLLAPVSRSRIVLAKFGVLFTIGLTSALLMVFSMGLLLLVFGRTLDNPLVTALHSIGALDLALVALMLLPTAGIFAALLLSISIYAKTYKEAAGLISPLIMVTILPTLVAVLPGVTLNWKWALLPLTNVSLAMKELVKGTLDYRMIPLILLSSTLVAGLLLAFCRWWFAREEVLFRS